MASMPYGLSVITGPGEEPLSVREALKQVELPSEEVTRHDEHLTRLIQAARELFEDQLSRSVITTTWELALPSFPATGIIRMPRANTLTIESVKYDDVDGAEQTFDSANYHTSLTRTPGEIRLIGSASWPSIECGNPEAVRVRFTAGYGADCDSVPQSVKLTLLFMVGEWFLNRVPEGEMNAGIRMMLNAHQWGDEFFDVEGGQS